MKNLVFKRLITSIILSAILIISLPVALAAANKYSWLTDYKDAESIAKRIKVPAGYERVAVKPGSFEEWLRFLPLKKGNPPVRLYNGQLKQNRDAAYAVVDMDTGVRDLQQCADTVIRFRAEYLYSVGDFSGIHFKFTSGHNAEYKKWIEGYRPSISGSRVSWVKSAKKNSSYENFRNGYLNTVFNYAGTASLEKELKSAGDAKQMRIGDVFMHAGYPGHAALVVDMAENKTTGKKIFLLAQSYMPAQEAHILNNPGNPALGPWYVLDFGTQLETPEWLFFQNELKSFK
ncbi:MAG: DUF4846 domain-containing protein [bacterium]